MNNELKLERHLINATIPLAPGEVQKELDRERRLRELKRKPGFRSMDEWNEMGRLSATDDYGMDLDLAFVLDKVAFRPTELRIEPAHPPFCTYEHVHGPPISSLMVRRGGGGYVTRSEHLGACGYGEPNFWLINHLYGFRADAN